MRHSRRADATIAEDLFPPCKSLRESLGGAFCLASSDDCSPTPPSPPTCARAISTLRGNTGGTFHLPVNYGVAAGPPKTAVMTWTNRSLAVHCPSVQFQGGRWRTRTVLQNRKFLMLGRQASAWRSANLSRGHPVVSNLRNYDQVPARRAACNAFWRDCAFPLPS